MACIPAEQVVDYISRKSCHDSRIGVCTAGARAYGEVQELFSIASVGGAYLVIYVIHDPRTGQIPFEPMNEWPKQVITDNTGRKVAIVYSPNLHRYALQKFATWSPDKKSYSLSKVPILFVNYHLPLDYKYYGPTKPPERPLEQQFADWENGRMYSRMYIPSTDEQRKKVNEIDSMMGAKMCEGWHWVVFHADLITLPSTLYTMESGIITFGYKLPKGANIPLAGDYIRSKVKQRIEKNIPFLVDVLRSSGLQVDNNRVYEVNGQQVKGITVAISQDNKSYEVHVPVVRVAGLALPAIPIATAMVITAIVLASITFVWAYIRLKDIKARQEALEVVRSTPENYKDLYQFLVNNGVNPDEAAKIAAGVTTSMNNALTQPQSDWEKYIKYGVAGFGLLIGAIIVLTLLQYLPKPRRG